MKGWLLLPTVSVFVLLGLGQVAATEDEKPFDQYSCWCSDIFLDVSIGHFDGARGFVIDRPVWNRGVPAERRAGTTLEIGYNLGSPSELFLIHDNSWHIGQWCFHTVSSLNPDEVVLRSTACDRVPDQGGVLPDSCANDARLSDVVRFAEATLFGGMRCREAADRYLGMGHDRGCNSGRESWVGLVVLGCLRGVARVWRAKGIR